MERTDVVIVGAGATGLMAARELGKAGKSVHILEAQNRIGGRVDSLPEEVLGYPAQAGAEFVHGDAKLTFALLKEAKLEIADSKGQVWNLREGVLTQDPTTLPQQELVHERLKTLKEDMPLSQFLERYFGGEEYAVLRNAATKMAEGYDAADSHKISTFALRDEWLGTGEWGVGRIKGGYGKLLEYLAEECEKYGVIISLGKTVSAITVKDTEVEIACSDGTRMNASFAIVTCSAPTVGRIQFSPAIPEKLLALERIGFGSVIKVLFRFKTRWWLNAYGQDLTSLSYLLCNEEFLTWWTQFPDEYPVLTGWLAGPQVDTYKNMSSTELVDRAIATLVKVFSTNEEAVRRELVTTYVADWSTHSFAGGAYSYRTPGIDSALEELRAPINGRVFFAGEALARSGEPATVDSALQSGKETSEEILAS